METMSLEALNMSLNQPYGSNSLLGEWTTCAPLLNTFYHHYPQTYWHWNEPNKFEQAFKILQKLIDKKMIEVDTVKKFIETLGEIQSVL